jgi:hypothetical protein
MSSAAAQPPSTSTNGASNRVSRRSSAGCVERTHDAMRRAPAGNTRQYRRTVIGADDEQQRGRVGGLEPGNGGTRRVVAVDNHRFSASPSAAADCDLGAGVDLDVIGETPDHPFELDGIGRFGKAVEPRVRACRPVTASATRRHRRCARQRRRVAPRLRRRARHATRR